MKILLLTFVICFASLGVAEVPKVYGKANLSVVTQNDGSTDEWNLNSNASR